LRSKHHGRSWCTPSVFSAVARPCPFTGPNAPKIDYRIPSCDALTSPERGKIVPSRITAVFAKKQRELARRHQRSRFLGLASLRDP